MAHKLSKRCMTFKLLTIACKIAGKDGIFSLNALRAVAKKEYPMFDRIFVTPIVQKVAQWKRDGYIVSVAGDCGRYRILPDTLEQCLDELTSEPSKIPQYFASF